MAAPPSQKYREISFRLLGPSSGSAASSSGFLGQVGALLTKAENFLNGPGTTFTFSIRPEELTRSEPSRLTVQQTLGGAWADAFDRGISVITLSGHNGWRGGLLSSGEDMFQTLRQTCFLGWHDARQKAVKAGQDPGQVKLYFTDSLDQISVVVAPRQFVLRRSKTSPLLMRYQIELLVLGDASAPDGILDTIINALSDPTRWIAGQLGLTNVLAVLNGLATQTVNALGAIGGSVNQFINTGKVLLQSVATTAEQLQGEFDQSQSALLDVGRSYSSAAANAFQALADDATLSAQYRMPIMATASAFNDAACNMANSFNVGKYFSSYDQLFGASGCSSTGGGDPWSVFTAQGLNPFEYMTPATAAPVIVTPEASAALATLNGDPLNLVGQKTQVGQLMQTAASGIKVAA